ncbi:acetyltransferase, N-acetylglutamate synthase [Halovivax ruber XH-70]|uniref:Acetyltransferase, N-acetylglutamate synthase n=1 Tax=Halovivax ruber (strain DSM 18193 / JCM 13892 / XH-70) TaxID=797302 RepID=L0IA26_HALRX|nr:GNAT family N-acetyltransferase [Halovivax ruber]AGB16440.1 acetyltransferase, N-acetylglutamate synthase [Halovivax ruber XH-70]
MEFVVREAVDDDAPNIRDVHRASIEGLAAQAYTDAQIAAWAHDRDPEQYPIDAAETYFLVAEREAQVVGFGWMKPDADDYFQTAINGEITAIYVHPTVARHGVGSRIYDELEAQAVRDGVASLGLWASRNAVPFYEAQGYTRLTDHVHEYRGETLTLVEMEKRPLR